MYESSSCFMSLSVPGISCPFHTGHLSLIKGETPLLPLALHPSLSPFSQSLPSSQALKCSLKPGLLHWLRGAVFGMLLLHHLHNASLRPLPHGVQPCCLPLVAKVLEGDISSLHLLLLTCSFFQSVLILSLSVVGIVGFKSEQDQLALLS